MRAGRALLLLILAAAAGCGADDEETSRAAPIPPAATAAPRARAALFDTAPAPAPAPAPEPIEPERASRPERVVFDLTDNRLLAHLYQGGGVWVDAGSASFARYARPGGEKVGWQLLRRRAGVRVAVLRRRGAITVPLRDEEAARPSGSIALAVHASEPAGLAIAVNGAAAGSAAIRRGWQLATVDLPAGALVSGENRVVLDAGKQSVAIAWIQVGGDPLAAEPAHAAPPPVFDREERALIDRPLCVGFRAATARKHLCVLRRHDDERLAAAEQPCAADISGNQHRLSERLRELCSRLAFRIHDFDRARYADDGNDALVAVEAAFDVQRRPRTFQFVFGKAQSKFSRLTKCRHVGFAGACSPGVLQHQTHRTADARVRAIAGSERVRAAVHSDLARDRSIDDDARRCRTGRRRNSEQIEFGTRHRAHRRAYDAQILGFTAGENRVDRDVVPRHRFVCRR